MPYPNSPFPEDFDEGILFHLKNDDEMTLIQNDMKKVLKWICLAPNLTTIRINTLKTSRDAVYKKVEAHLKTINSKYSGILQYLESFPQVILLLHQDIEGKIFEKYEKEIIVDADCGAAVLRGAHIYAPGILGMMIGSCVNDNVSIYVDLDKKCKKGFSKVFTDGTKIFIANGIIKMARHDLFGKEKLPKGIAVEITETLSGCPPIGDNFLPAGWGLLQNFPSIVCVNVLNPQKHEIILDMCAAPGNKTTYIAALMENTGSIIAIDKTPNKVQQLIKTCEEFGANVKVYQADSTKILNNSQNHSVQDRLDMAPPFFEKSFDRILLDAPCSALGRRPQLSNRTSVKVIRSYVPLQRRLFETAVSLLKPGGTLVYSTCTITLAENEGIVAWALRTFNCLKLAKSHINIGGPGWKGTSLNEEERLLLQRFGPNQELDSVGFFIACFVKQLEQLN
ncbi:putative methyltransferase NSUN6 [Sitophilus oryzae]|uniref:Methyltransferase NSUN6 n=1 Tax=Sitophilus oryzae TaxID=7048 RepID=A0A6J2XRC4_SITOR|nr:putative methyltransferase NSUN6 [Sitophilus oryzae]